MTVEDDHLGVLVAQPPQQLLDHLLLGLDLAVHQHQLGERGGSRGRMAVAVAVAVTVTVTVTVTAMDTWVASSLVFVLGAATHLATTPSITWWGRCQERRHVDEKDRDALQDDADY